jgi:1-acyl-sn-glycerol-3-phosphate acyltransferase
MNLSATNRVTKTNKNLQPIDSHINPFLIRLAYPLACRVVIPLVFRHIEIIGQENIPLEGPVLVAPTHRSRWDALLVPYAIGRWISGRDLRFMVTADEYNRPIQGWFIRRLGGFPVNVERPGLSSLAHSVKLLSQGEMITIFPEGGIVREEKVRSLKRGVARIALDVESANSGSGIKILPISLKYDRPFPGWGSSVKIEIGAAIDVANYASPSLKKSSERLTKVLESALKELHETEVVETEAVSSDRFSVIS